MFKRAIIVSLLMSQLGAAEQPLLCPALSAIKPGAWSKVHEQKPGDAVIFQRQHHGGSCFDTKRGRFVHFGSNSHGKDWLNSPLIFDVVKLTWSRSYPDDAFETYRVNAAGVAVCGAKQDHPWSMHTFGAVNYDTKRDEMVVACFDEHLKPGNFTDAFKDLYPLIKATPTWAFRFSDNSWQILPGDGVSFFPHSTTFDTDRHVVVGYRPEGIYEYGGEPRQWRKVCASGGFGYSQNCAYDANNKAVVIFGAVGGSNDIGAYAADKGTYRIMPTTGTRPAKDQHCAMEFHPRLGKTVVLVDRPKGTDGAASDTTETWLYDLGDDNWSRIESATLPFVTGMNMNMEYDPANNVMWLMTGGYSGEGPTAMWALKLGK
jgi:hypothetical protein